MDYVFGNIGMRRSEVEFDEFTGECNQKTQVAVEKLQFSSNFTEYQLPKNS